MRTLDYLPENKQKSHRAGDDGYFCAARQPPGHLAIQVGIGKTSVFAFWTQWNISALPTASTRRRAEREEDIHSIIQFLSRELERNGVMDAQFTGRPKHIYSIYSKMDRKGASFEQIHDIRAVRIIVNTVPAMLPDSGHHPQSLAADPQRIR